MPCGRDTGSFHGGSVFHCMMTSRATTSRRDARGAFASPRALLAILAIGASACGTPSADQTADVDSLVATTPRFVSITAGRQFTCALDDGGKTWCWGSNRRGQLGLGDTLDRFLPTRLQHSVPFTRIVAGETHVCAVDTLSALHCWGDNREYALGDSTVRVQARPSTVSVRSVRAVAAGARFTCVIDRQGESLCWGSDRHGERGDGDGTSPPTPVPVRVQTTVSFASLIAGRTHACGLTASGAAWCWGDGRALGNGTLITRDAPIEVLGQRVFSSLTAGESVTCGIAEEARAWCWGIAFEGQLGYGSQPRPNAFVPEQVAGSTSFQALSAGLHRVCGLDIDGLAWCWGSNYNGALGNGSGVSESAPVRVSGDRRYIALASGDFHACALDEQGAAWCWGENTDARGGGALGDGTVRSRAVPTRVAAPSSN